MELPEVLDPQLEEGAPSEDVLDAAGEVLNTLTSAVNKVRENFHVKVSALEVMHCDEIPWLSTCRGRQDYNVSSGGTISVVLR